MRPTILFSAMVGLAIASGGVGAEPSGGAKSAATTNPAAAIAASDGEVVLDETTVWRQFQVGGTHHIRTADSNLVPGRVQWEMGSFGPAHGAIHGKALGAPCRHARKEGEGAGGSSSNRTFCGEMSQPPPAEWAGLSMDDSVWPRVFLPQPVPTASLSPNQGTIFGSYNIYETVLLFARTRFAVNDPAQVKNCTLSLDYWGGVVVYVNGREVARGDMPGKGPDLASPAVDYPAEAFLKPDGKVLSTDDEKNQDRLALRNRQLRDVKIPASVLRKGVNILAVEVHAAPVNARVFGESYGGHAEGWPPVGLLNARLTVSPAGMTPTLSAVGANRSRSKGIQIWNCGPCDTLSVFDHDMAAPLKPIVVRAARNSVFSGRLMVGSDQPIKGLKVTVSDLEDAPPSLRPDPRTVGTTTRRSGNKIAASAVRVRYAVASQEGKSWVGLTRFDGLLDTIPAEIPAVDVKPSGVSLYHLRMPPKPLVPGAVAPLWFTVRVPRDVPPGLYEGKVSISADGLALTAIPLRVEVCAWTMPDPKDFRVQNFLYHAEEVYAKYYSLTNYSDKHLEMIGQSLAIMAEANSRQVEANLAVNFFGFGWTGANPESLVRWIKQPDGSFKHDYKNFDRYLDMVGKYVGMPNTLRLNCWGSYSRWDNPSPLVTVLDPATGQLSTMPQPAAGTPESLAFWRPVFAEMLKKIKARGWLDVTTLGNNAHCDLPTPGMVDVAHTLWPEGEWSFSSHSAAEGLKFVGTDTNVVMTVRHADGVASSPTGRLPPLWALDKPRRNTFCNGCRNAIGDSTAIREYRRLVELSAVNASYDGVSEFGVDLFPLKKPAGGYAAPNAGRGTGWAGQGMALSLLYPGPDGPVATERFEMFREGVELCEAVLFLRRAVADKKLSADLQQRTEQYLAERNKTIQGDFAPRYIQTEEDAKLLTLAGEVARDLAREEKRR